MSSLKTEFNSFLLALLLTALHPRGAFTFNVDISWKHGEIFTSSTIRSTETSNTDANHLKIEENPLYFGYSLELRQIKTDQRLFIGSPKAKHDSLLRRDFGISQADHEGGIYSCAIGTENFLQNNHRDDLDETKSCRPVFPSNSKPGDGFGQTVAISSDGKITACSLSRTHNCSSVVYLPGFCYTSMDAGSTWAQDEISQRQRCHTATVDVMFVLDGSNSVQNDFGKIKKWVKNVTKSIDLEKGTVRVGVVQYSTYIWKKPHRADVYLKTEIELGEFERRKKFEKALDNIKWSGGGTMTGAALWKVRGDFNTSSRFKLKTNKQVMILLTDGRSNNGPNARRFAKELRDIGVIPYVIGVGSEIDRVELRMIANGNTSDERVFEVESFDGLHEIVENLKSEILKFQLEAQTNNNASFSLEFGEIGFSSSYSKQPQSGVNNSWFDPSVLATNSVGQVSKATARFLYRNLSDSDLPYYGYDVLLTNVSEKLKLTISAPGGGYGSSSSGSVYFCTLDTDFSVENETANCTGRVSIPETKNDFGISLSSSISGKVSSCSVTLPEYCDSLLALPGFCYEFSDEDDSWKKWSFETDLGCPNVHVDVLFLLDGSGSIDPTDFIRELNWVKDITDSLGIENGTIDVGVIQFSKDVRLDIALGQYRNTAALGNAILAIKQDRSTTNTGNALAEAVEIFQSNSERNDKDSKIMILLTDGISNNRADVQTNAQKLRDINVQTYAVGVGSSVVEDELRIIATGDTSSNERVFTITGFQQLSGIVNDLQNTILSYSLEGGTC